MIRTQNCDHNRTTALAPSVPSSTATSGSYPVGSSRDQPLAVAATTFPDSEVGALTLQAQKPGVSLGRFPSLSCSGSWEERPEEDEAEFLQEQRRGSPLGRLCCGLWDRRTRKPVSSQPCWLDQPTVNTCGASGLRSHNSHTFNTPRPTIPTGQISCRFGQ